MKTHFERLQSINKELAAIVILGLAVFSSYSNVYFFDFVYDDEFFIVKNEFLNSFRFIHDIFASSSTGGAGFKDSLYRPLQFVIYLFVKSVVGPEAWGFHLLNIGIHFLNAVLVFFLIKKLRLSFLAAFSVALLWCVHPIHTECIAYKSATADSLHSFFLLLGLHFLFPEVRLRNYILGWICFLLAILSKETAVLGALLFTSCLFFFDDKRWEWRTYIKTIPFWGLSLSYTLLRKTLLNFDGDFSFYKENNIYSENFIYRFYTFLATLPEYLRLLIWPENLHIDRQFSVYVNFFTPLVLMGAVLCIAAVLVLFWMFIRPSKVSFLIGFSVMWFASTHLLHSGVILPLNSLFLEHWMYMPSIAFFILIGIVLDVLFMYRRWLKMTVLASVFVAASFLAIQTFSQNYVWANSINLFSHILKFNPHVARVRHGLAMAYSDRGEDSKAMELYTEALKQQVYPQTYHNMALIYLKQNQLGKAEEYLLKALETDPQFFPSYPYLIQLYAFLKKDDLKQKYEQLYQKFRR